MGTDTHTPLIFFFKVPIQGKLLAEYEVPFPNLKPDPVSRIMVGWQSLVNDFDEPMEDNEYETVKAFMVYSCALSAPVQKEVKRLEAGSAEEVALASLGAFAASLSLQCTCHGIKLILDKPKEKWEVDKILLPEWRPIAMILPSVGNLEKEMKSLDESPNDFKLFTSHLPLFETCAGVAASAVTEDKSLAHLKDPCEAFTDKFASAILQALTNLQTSSLKVIEEFVNKFSEVSEAAGDWRMESFQWVHQGDETKRRFEKLHVAITAGQTFLVDSRPFLSLRSSHAKVKNSIKEIIDFTTVMKKNLHQVRSVAGTVMVSGLFLNKEDPHLDVNTIMEHCYTMYGTTLDGLPGKLKTMTAKAIEDAKKKPDDTSKGDAKSKNPKDKKRKKDKKDKDEEGKKEKKRKS